MKKSKITQVGEPAGTLPQNIPNPSQRMLAFSSRRLLTEKSSFTTNPFLLDVKMETLTIRATMQTTIMTEIPSYNHCGLND
jgi:hypothetical protein